jgi:hypothetical protein
LFGWLVSKLVRVAGKIMSMNKSSDIIGNGTHDFPACSAVPQPTAPPRAPLFHVPSPKSTFLCALLKALFYVPSPENTF